MRATRKDSSAEISSTAELARRLHLSRWTVSRVLNGHDGVHPATVVRIRAAMSLYGFTPNALAQGLKTGRTNIIGICLPELEAFYLGEKLEFLRHALTANGYHVMVGMTSGDAREEIATLNRFRELRAAGVLLVASQIPSSSVAVRQFLKSGTPLIQIDPMTEPSVGSICIDRGEGMKEAVRHLFELGHRHIATVGLLAVNGRYSQQRLQGVVAAYEDQGLDAEKYFHPFSLASEGNSFSQWGYQSAEAVCAHRNGPKRHQESITAILALNDRLAIGLMDGLRERGVRVPEDLSLIGYDNMEVGAFISPKLTSIDARPDELVRKSTEQLLERIRKEETTAPPSASIPARLLRRGSTGPVRQKGTAL